eukprot:CAMPEP_0178694096 /NCGR_PEP_ID=MMETSP0699-20121125/8062_1 /TAXON_ID=265572 /ORGANISM="Extubocellulus spinifer, Strain CCMP396" /LENGTH=269 /DNA_ID=CAMNT_0020339549 /DNA_START=1565 /DNA_END=2374 /DNA_ORIENTATION=-
MKGRSQSRGRHNNIEPSFSNSPYLSSPIRPIAPKSRRKSQEGGDSLAPLRDVTISTGAITSPDSVRTTQTRHSSRQRAKLLQSDDCCSLADATVASVVTTRTLSRASPYLSSNRNGTATGRSKSTGRLRGSASNPKPPKLLLMPDEVDNMILEFKKRQHEERLLQMSKQKQEEATEKLETEEEESEGKEDVGKVEEGACKEERGDDVKSDDKGSDKTDAKEDEKEEEYEYEFSDDENTVDSKYCEELDDIKVMERIRAFDTKEKEASDN